MIWACFTARGPEHFAVMESIMNSSLHKGILESNVTCMQQDNDTKHSTMAQSMFKAQPKSNAVMESWSPVKTVLYIVMQNIWFRLLIKNESSWKELAFFFVFVLLATPTSQVQPVALKTN